MQEVHGYARCIACIVWSGTWPTAGPSTSHTQTSTHMRWHCVAWAVHGRGVRAFILRRPFTHVHHCKGRLIGHSGSPGHTATFTNGRADTLTTRSNATVRDLDPGESRPNARHTTPTDPPGNQLCRSTASRLGLVPRRGGFACETLSIPASHHMVRLLPTPGVGLRGGPGRLETRGGPMHRGGTTRWTTRSPSRAVMPLHYSSRAPVL